MESKASSPGMEVRLLLARNSLVSFGAPGGSIKGKSVKALNLRSMYSNSDQPAEGMVPDKRLLIILRFLSLGCPEKKSLGSVPFIIALYRFKLTKFVKDLNEASGKGMIPRFWVLLKEIFSNWGNTSTRASQSGFCPANGHESNFSSFKLEVTFSKIFGRGGGESAPVSAISNDSRFVNCEMQDGSLEMGIL
jgi:hypothetical protein